MRLVHNAGIALKACRATYPEIFATASIPSMNMDKLAGACGLLRDPDAAAQLAERTREAWGERDLEEDELIMAYILGLK